MTKPKVNEPKILAAVKQEVSKEQKKNHLRRTSNACDSSCSGDNYCSDYSDNA